MPKFFIEIIYFSYNQYFVFVLNTNDFVTAKLRIIQIT